MKPINGGLIIFVLLLASACSKPFYQSNDFNEQTAAHQTVAIIPVQMVFNGSPLGSLSGEDKTMVEEAESKAFQISLFRELLYSANGKKSLKVTLMPVEQTNNKLEKANISIRESWDMMPNELADILGVDAVIKTTVYKKRYLTDLASYGINISSKVLALLTKGRSLLALGTGNKIDKTNSITAHCSLYNEQDGQVLWSMSLQDDTDWKKPTNEVIDDINRQFAKHFPYRK